MPVYCIITVRGGFCKRRNRPPSARSNTLNHNRNIATHEQLSNQGRHCRSRPLGQGADTRRREVGQPEIAQQLKKNPLVVLPAGSVEQHGPHLPTGTDIYASQVIGHADAIAREATDIFRMLDEAQGGAAEKGI